MQREKKRILLVEDDESFRDSVRKLLEREGFEVREASSGEVGLELLKTERIDLVLLDLYLGGISGLEFLARLGDFRRDNWCPKIVMVSAFGDAGAFAEALAGGAFHCLAKPVKRAELVSVIGRALADMG